MVYVRQNEKRKRDKEKRTLKPLPAKGATSAKDKQDKQDKPVAQREATAREGDAACDVDKENSGVCVCVCLCVCAVCGVLRAMNPTPESLAQGRTPTETPNPTPEFPKPPYIHTRIPQTRNRNTV